MDIIIENLLELYKDIKPKKNNAKTIAMAILLSLSLLILLVAYALKNLISPTKVLILLIIPFIFLGISYFVFRSLRKDKFKNTSDYLEKIDKLDQTLKNGSSLLKITTKEGYKMLLEQVEKYYFSKFTNFDKTKKIILDIAKLIILPTGLLILEGAISDKTVVEIMKIETFSGFFIFLLLVTTSIYIIFELIELFYLCTNVQLKLLIKDLEVLSNFDIISTNKLEPPKTELKLIYTNDEELKAYMK